MLLLCAATAYGCGVLCKERCGLAATAGCLESSLLWGGAACGLASSLALRGATDCSVQPYSQPRTCKLCQKC